MTTVQDRQIRPTGLIRTNITETSSHRQRQSESIRNSIASKGGDESFKQLIQYCADGVAGGVQRWRQPRRQGGNVGRSYFEEEDARVEVAESQETASLLSAGVAVPAPQTAVPVLLSPAPLHTAVQEMIQMGGCS